MIPKPANSMWRQKAANFCRHWNFPNRGGSLDGKHNETECPANSG